MESRLTGEGAIHKGRQRWQQELLEAPSDVRAVASELGLPDDTLDALTEAARHHRFRTTRGYLSLVDPTDPSDPILAQLLPDPRELDPSPPGYLDDAVGDVAPENHPAPGLVHKYPGRALLVTTSACAVYCRFCFRRAFPYDELRDARRLEEARAVIADDPSIHEVILSGGDPLSWTDAALARLVRDLAAIKHVRRIRVHSRMPVVLPSRITPGLLEALTGTRLTVWFVTHFNHPRELSPDCVAACRALSNRGVPVLNQSVLLRGVNDDVAVLAELCEALVDVGIKPYYLHQLDRVHGTAHFEVPEDDARGIVARLRARVSGIAMPTWVRDVPGNLSKTPLVLLVLALLVGCGGGDPAATKPEPPRIDRSLSGVEARTPDEGPSPAAEPTPEEVPELEGSEFIDPGPPPPADRVLVADLFGDGNPEVFVAEGGDVRWGEWPATAPQPSFSSRHVAKGMLQAWMAEDLDGDGDQEVVMAFGLGRGFTEAKAEVVVVQDFPQGTVARPIWRSDGERNQVTALLPWRRPGGGSDIYVAHFATRFMVRGGVLSREGGEPEWLEGHELRMGMARAVGDFDGDRRTEVAIGRLYGDSSNEDGDLRVIQEDGAVEMVPTLRGVRAVGAGDLDGDGKAELLFGDGWHKNYGKLARYRPNVAARGRDGAWAVATLDERKDNYAIEQIGVVGRAVIAGGNATLGAYVYDVKTGWGPVGARQPVRGTGGFAAMPDGTLILSGEQARRWTPGASADVAPDEQKEPQRKEKR